MTALFIKLLIPILNFLYNMYRSFPQKYIRLMGIILLVLTFLTLAWLYGVYGYNEYSTVITGRIAFFELSVILLLPILSRVFGSKCAQNLLWIRKELWISMGIFALVHSMYQIQNVLDVYDITKLSVWWKHSLPTVTSSGFTAFIVTMILFLTSNTFSQKFLGKNWKKLHRLAYILGIITVGHMMLLPVSQQTLFWWAAWFLMVFIIGKMLEWSGVQFFKEHTTSYPKWQKFLCIPCGYIYDPAIGDIDWGIAPGTEFIDIPDDWHCPECGVTKSDFVPYNQWDMSYNKEPVSIIQKKFLNPTTIELTLTKPNNIHSNIGQFATFELSDAQWVFRRQYSVSSEDTDSMQFLIKLYDMGRWSKILRTKQVGDTIDCIGFFGDFLLQDTTFPKIFLATGTGLAPIYRMMKSIPEIPKTLYIAVATYEEVFYREELKHIPNLRVYYHITREDKVWFERWRFDVSSIMPDNEVEWYLCGNPEMIERSVNALKANWQERIYFEKF